MWSYRECSCSWLQNYNFRCLLHTRRYLRHDRALFHDLLSSPISRHSVWSVITVHNFTTLKRDHWPAADYTSHSWVKSRYSGLSFLPQKWPILCAVGWGVKLYSVQSSPATQLELHDVSSKISECVSSVSKRMSLNYDKTKVLRCTSGRRQHQLTSNTLSIHSTFVEPLKSARDLGVSFGKFAVQCRLTPFRPWLLAWR